MEANRSPLVSMIHATLLSAFTLVLALASPAAAAPQPQDLRFIPSVSADVASYRVDATDQATSQTSTFNFANSFALDSEGAATITINLEEGATYSVTMTAIGTNGLESSASNAIILDIPAPPPPPGACASNSDCMNGDVCDGLESCVNNACVSGTPLLCPSAGTCGLGMCHNVLGCVIQDAPNGTACNDGDAGTNNDMCSAGACTGTPVGCLSDAECSDGSVCNGAEQCVNSQCVSAAPAANGTTCDDGSAQTVNDVCTAGACAGAVPECFNDSTCSDGNACNGAEQCVQNQCVAAAAPAANGTTCDDGNAQTMNDMCAAGACAGTVAECFNDSTCSDLNACNGAEQCVQNQCVAAAAPAANGTTCDDGNAQTVNDMCAAGSCAGTVAQCFADAECADADICNGAEICVNNQCAAALATAVDGTTCNDGNAGTVRDMCTQAICVGVVPECAANADCDDLNACNGQENCLNDFCVSQAPLLDGTTCDDGNAGTINDQCLAMVCQGVTPQCVADADCSDNQLCNGVETCVSNVCVSTGPATDGTTCDDGDPATVADRCEMQVCSGVAPVAMADMAIVATIGDETVGAGLAGNPATLHQGTIPGSSPPVWCDLDGDGLQEIVVGQGRGSGGIVMIHSVGSDGSITNTTTLSAGYSVYNLRNGETRPACGDFDGDGRDEIFVGLGSGANGLSRIFDDSMTGFAASSRAPGGAGMIKLPDTSGATPIAGDLDGDGLDEVIVAFDGDPGALYLLEDGTRYFAKMNGRRVSKGHLELLGNFARTSALHPALGDVDGDGMDELFIGFGPGGGGAVLQLGDIANGFEDEIWIQAGTPAYSATDGQTHPALGDLDGDGLDELVVGFGPSAGTSVLVLDDAGTGFSDYPGLPQGLLDLGGPAANGPIRPAVR